MYGNFTDRFRNTVRLANSEAESLGCQFIQSEHFLLGLLKLGGGVSGEVLANHAIEYDAVRAEVMKLSARREELNPVPPSTKQIIECSMKEAAGLDHELVDVGHLLIALLSDSSSTARLIVMNLGGRPEEICRDVRAKISSQSGDK